MHALPDRGPPRCAALANLSSTCKELVMPSAELSSWNNSPAKTAILDFVARVTSEGGPDHVPPADRIATFDNDGTLWCEQPLQVQFSFAQHRLNDMVARDPSLAER